MDVLFWIAIGWVMGFSLLVDLNAMKLSAHLHASDHEAWLKLGKPSLGDGEGGMIRPWMSLRFMVMRMMFGSSKWVKDHVSMGGTIVKLRLFYGLYQVGVVYLVVDYFELV